MERDQIRAGTVVQSLAGKDKGVLYVVVDRLTYPYVQIADGRKYKLDRPKKKNCRHLRILGAVETVPANYSDEWIRAAVKRAAVELTREVLHV